MIEKLNGSGSDSFNQTFDYDRYGNRTINAAATFNAPEPQFDNSQMAATNRLYSPYENFSDTCPAPAETTRWMCYDLAGNLIRDKHVTNAAWMTYDAENKMLRHNFNDVQNDTIIYTYDADGKRKESYSDAVGSTRYIHGLGGELLYEVLGSRGKTEYGYRSGELLITTSVGKPGQSDVKWLITDHLGTPRIVADQTGNLSAVKRHDYLPFGEEIGSTIGGRNTTQGYAAPQSDGVRQQFTGYERDSATGLDFAQARYMGSSLGRFTSPDPLMASASRGDPQSFNRYTYVRNSPLVMVDPTGLFGDYYDHSGNFINSDGMKDGMVYFATYSGTFGGHAYVYTDSIDETTIEEVNKARSFFSSAMPGSESEALQTLGTEVISGIDDAGTGMIRGAENLTLRTMISLASIGPNGPVPAAIGLSVSGADPVPYDNARQASYGSATEVGLAGGSILAGNVFGGASSLPSVVPKGPVSTTGSYLHTFESGNFYAGKGPISRMNRTGSSLSRTYNDPLVSSEFFPASSNRAAFINEHRLMMQNGGPVRVNEAKNTYNLIFSPGRKLGGF